VTDSGSIEGVQKACEISSGNPYGFLADLNWSLGGQIELILKSTSASSAVGAESIRTHLAARHGETVGQFPLVRFAFPDR
jgi:hypothetical protein